jgi:hypothetical protein
VYVLSPEQTGSALTTGPDTDNGSPQELSTEGGVGTAWASAIQATIDPPAGGIINVGAEIV